MNIDSEHMEVNKEHMEAMNALADAHKNLIALMKSMPEDVDVSLHLEKTGKAIRVEKLSCKVVKPLIYQRAQGYDEDFPLHNALLHRCWSFKTTSGEVLHKGIAGIELETF